MQQINPEKKRRAPALIATLILTLGIGAGLAYWINTYDPFSSPDIVTTQRSLTSSSKKSASKPTEVALSTDEPGSLWWIVNKNRPAGEHYIPDSLVSPGVTLNSAKSHDENSIRSDVAPAVKELFANAEKNGLHLMFASGYRSYQLQSTYYNNYVKTSGQAEADRYSARPGTSEHQTGLSFDVARADRKNYLEQDFGKEPEGQWLAAHAHEYGFIIRYPKDKESVTGYMYEPWHLRYVGKELAGKLYSGQQTMEEYFKISQ